jgi:type IV pilus modification protein PilV
MEMPGNNTRIRNLKKRGQAGFTLVETMIAMTVLVVGLLALSAIVMTAVASNNKNKLDTRAVTVAQEVLEMMASQPADTSPTLSVADCNPDGATTWSVATAASAAPGSGALLDASTGAIDFTQAYSAVPQY